MSSPRSVLLGLALAVAGGCSRTPASSAAKAPATVVDAGRFQISTAEVRRIERTIPVTGSLLPIDQTPVSVKVAGRLQEIAVDLGSFVREGDLVARVDHTDYDLRLRQAEAALGQARARVGLAIDGEDDVVDEQAAPNVKEAKAVLDEARANRERIAALSQQGILSMSELETANATFKVTTSRHDEALEEGRIRIAQLRQRRAEFEIAQKQLADTYIVAPFDGAVQERRANVGEYLAVGAAVVVMVRVDPLRLRVEVSERDAGRVRIGQTVRVSVEGENGAVQGQVRRLSPALAQGSRTLVVEADVPSQGRLRPGSFARAQIVILADAPAITVPPDAIVSFAGVEKVFARVNGLSVERRIVTGDRGAGWTEIVEGLKAGEEVVLVPGSLQAGQRVQTAAPEDPKNVTASGANRAKGS